MSNRKNVRARGKIPFSRCFQEFDKGDSVSVISERSVTSSFPKRIQGRTGKIEDKRGKSYMVRINDQKKEKKFLIAPIHLKKIKN